MSEQFDWSNLRTYWEREHKKDKNHATVREKELLRTIKKAYEELETLGWQPAIYCPKNGTTFLCAIAGSTWASPCTYEGEWPNGAWWLHEAGDSWPCYPILWRPI